VAALAEEETLLTEEPLAEVPVMGVGQVLLLAQQVSLFLEEKVDKPCSSYIFFLVPSNVYPLL